MYVCMYACVCVRMCMHLCKGVTNKQALCIIFLTVKKEMMGKDSLEEAFI